MITDALVSVTAFHRHLAPYADHWLTCRCIRERRSRSSGSSRLHSDLQEPVAFTKLVCDGLVNERATT